MRFRNTNLLFRTFAGSLFCIICPILPVSAAKSDSVPDWVHEAAKQPLPQYPAQARAVILLEDTTYTVDTTGQTTEHFRQVIKILRPNGRQDGLVQVPYDKERKILSLHVWSIAPDGHEYAVRDQDMVDIGYPGQGNFYDDEKRRAANPPGRDPGGIVAYEYEQRVRPYLTETTWFFQDDLPRLHESFTLQMPPGFTFGTVWANHEELKAVDLEKQRWHWEMNNVPMLNLEDIPMRPSGAALAGRMTIHYAGSDLAAATNGSWQSIGQWYDTLSHDRLSPTPEIAAKAAELTAGKTDFYDKAQAIAEFVQKDVRYFAIEMGIGGMQPHPAGEIFRNRYGDCKDKATLLSSMLSTVGVHAALMMVDHRRGVIAPDAPSTVGDHMISAIEVPPGYQSDKLHSVITAKTGKRYLIFDPTWDKTPFGQVEHELQGGYGALMEGKDSQIISIPVMSPSRNTIARTGHFRLDDTGSLSGSVTVNRFGDLSDRWRELYTAGDEKEQQNGINSYLKQDLTTFAVKDIKVENAASLNKDLTTSFSLDAEHFGKSMGTLLMVRPRIFGIDSLVTDHKPRSLPIDLNETRQEKDEYDIDIPAGYVVDEMPPSVHLDLGFASYSSATEKRGNTLHYSRTYTVSEVALPASRYTDVQRLADVINRDEQSSAILKKQ